MSRFGLMCAEGASDKVFVFWDSRRGHRTRNPTSTSSLRYGVAELEESARPPVSGPSVVFHAFGEAIRAASRTQTSSKAAARRTSCTSRTG